MVSPGKRILLRGENIALLRKLAIGWNSCEAGAPCVDLVETFGSEAVLRQADVIDAFEIILQLGELKPGRYKLPNHLRHMHPSGSFIIDCSGDDRFEFPQSDAIAFELSVDHLRLVRRLNTVGLFIDAKRPYGDLAYFQLDMANILGLPVSRSPDGQAHFTVAQLSYLQKLHLEMLYAVQAFVSYACIQLGAYGHNGFRCWHRLYEEGRAAQSIS